MVNDLNRPLISVVISVYNGAAYIKESLDSLLAQTLQRFELIIIDDGSSDGSADIIKSYNDSRIRFYGQSNKGLVESLNRGIGLAKGSLIARQDADDISKADRLEKQLAFLESNPDVVIVGSSISVMDTAGNLKHEHRVLLNDTELKQELLVRSPFAHGSVMFKKEVFDKAGGYRQDEWPAEDYDLWLRMSSLGHFANLDEPLYIYRESAGSISSLNSQEQEKKKQSLRAVAWSQRERLLSKKIDTSAYQDLEMGQQRIERITHNLLFALRRSLSNFNLLTAVRVKILILRDRGIRRKCARLIAIRLGLKHV